MSELSDEELGKFCSTDKKINKLCKDETFWRNRTFNRFSEVFTPEELTLYKEKFSPESWRNYYISLVNVMEQMYDGLFPEKYIKHREDFDLLYNYMSNLALALYTENSYNLTSTLQKMKKYKLINPYFIFEKFRSKREYDALAHNILNSGAPIDSRFRLPYKALHSLYIYFENEQLFKRIINETKINKVQFLYYLLQDNLKWFVKDLIDILIEQIPLNELAEIIEKMKGINGRNHNYPKPYIFQERMVQYIIAFLDKNGYDIDTLKNPILKPFIEKVKHGKKLKNEILEMLLEKDEIFLEEQYAKVKSALSENRFTTT